MKPIKRPFRLLPLFIFVAVLSLSVKINSVYDIIINKELPRISISQNKAWAEEQEAKETEKLTAILENNAETPNSETNSASSNFSKSEIAILQELAERREALDIRSQEIDKKAIQLKVAEEEIDKKLAQLQNYEEKLKNLINIYNEKE